MICLRRGDWEARMTRLLRSSLSTGRESGGGRGRGVRAGGLLSVAS